MPELPDITLYCEALEARIVGARLESAELRGISLLRTVEPPLSAAQGRRVAGIRRLGKRVVIALEDELFLVIHLMIAGRLAFAERAAGRGAGRSVLARFHFGTGCLTLTESGTKKRASLHVVRGEAALAALDPGGLEVLASDLEAFRAVLQRRNHTLKRALTDPRIFSGIGNAYSDEILHRARLSPFRHSARLDADEVARLRSAARSVLAGWTERLRAEAGGGFPTKVTAFRPGMAVHGRFRQPCPECGSPVQRIVQAETECHYCARCQCGGKLLADRALSKLLRSDWPKTLDELEARRKENP